MRRRASERYVAGRFRDRVVRYEASAKGGAIRFASILRRSSARAAFWKSVPPSSLVLFYAGIFCLFGTLGFLILMAGANRLTPLDIALNVLFSGGIAALCAAAAVRQKYVLLPVIAAAQIIGYRWLRHVYPERPPLVNAHSPFMTQLQYLSVGGALSLAAGYAFFISFFSREGIRFFSAHTEIALARELHRALVPEVHRTIGDYEIYGASVPSGEVGGDLVDLVEGDGEWTAYIGDVSGHGVSPGVLMAMFKAAVRARLLVGCDASGLLSSVHETLYPLKTANMFVTAGVLHSRGGELTLSLAGHPALLHFQRHTGETREYPAEDMPLGIFPQQSFGSRAIQCERGDILLLLTDGISEVADKDGSELGVEPIKAGLRQWAELPLPELFRNIRELALGFGKQEDDQTVLLVRKS